MKEKSQSKVGAMDELLETREGGMLQEEYRKVEKEGTWRGRLGKDK